mmetsp:Transcript_33829/g.93450  ORF Transcript_33829/g.93450 Transcript_33829/m.93450 type:complete len:722 (+) Transcript_33829:93-2258(+)
MAPEAMSDGGVVLRRSARIAAVKAKIDNSAVMRIDATVEDGIAERPKARQAVLKRPWTWSVKKNVSAEDTITIDDDNSEPEVVDSIAVEAGIHREPGIERAEVVRSIAAKGDVHHGPRMDKVEAISRLFAKRSVLIDPWTDSADVECIITIDDCSEPEEPECNQAIAATQGVFQDSGGSAVKAKATTTVDQHRKPGASDCNPEVATTQTGRQDRGREAAKLEATMTVDEWKEFQTEEMAEKWPKPEYLSLRQAFVPVRSGGEGQYRDRTYEIVTRWMAETRISYRPRAKRPGSKSHVRYEKYSSARTVGEALKLGSYPMDWCFDYEHGFLKVDGPVRDEPIDNSKVEDPSRLTDVDNSIINWYRRELARKYNVSLADLATEKGSTETIIMRAHRLVANRKAEEFLRAAEEEKRAVTDAEVETVLKTWAFNKNPGRLNVMREGQNWVWSDTIGLLRDRSGSIHIVTATTRYPAFTRIICKWLYDRIPDEVASFKFTSLNLNCNYAAKRHRDGNNFGPSMIKAFGDFTGGELNIFSQDDKSRSLDCLPLEDKMKVNLRSQLMMFNGNSAHEVDDFTGNRFSVVYFTAGCHAQATMEDKAALAELGFPFPAVDEDPHALLDRPRGYGDVKGAPNVPKKTGDSTQVRLWSSDALAARSSRCGWGAREPPTRESSPSPKKVMRFSGLTQSIGVTPAFPSMTSAARSNRFTPMSMQRTLRQKSAVAQ